MEFEIKSRYVNLMDYSSGAQFGTLSMQQNDFSVVSKSTQVRKRREATTVSAEEEEPLVPCRVKKGSVSLPLSVMPLHV